jgi:predicted  nucleic acid-binding Zn-ribbon protein
MADAPDHLVLEILRRMDTKVDRVLDDLHDLKVRMTGVETALAGVQRRIDRVEDRLDHIERRLGLADAHPGQ